MFRQTFQDSNCYNPWPHDIPCRFFSLIRNATFLLFCYCLQLQRHPEKIPIYQQSQIYSPFSAFLHNFFLPCIFSYFYSSFFSFLKHILFSFLPINRAVIHFRYSARTCPQKQLLRNNSSAVVFFLFKSCFFF